MGALLLFICSYLQPTWTRVASNLMQMLSSSSQVCLWRHFKSFTMASPKCGVSVTAQKQTGRQVFLPAAFRQPLAAGLDRAKAITNATGVFIAVEMQPYLHVENADFKHMVKVLDFFVPLHLLVHLHPYTLPPSPGLCHIFSHLGHIHKCHSWAVSSQC